MFRLTLFGYFIIASLLFIAGCSGSEETSGDQRDNPEEFIQIDDTNAPVLPEEGVSDENPRMPEEPAETETWNENSNVKPKNIETDNTAPEVRTVEAAPATHTEPATGTQTLPPNNEAQKNAGLMMWSVQIGAFKEENGAIRLVQEAKSALNQPIYKDYDPVSGFYKVTVGSFTSQEQASRFKQDVRAAGYPDAFTVEVRR
jgi:cell division septation protein DedD